MRNMMKKFTSSLKKALCFTPRTRKPDSSIVGDGKSTTPDLKFIPKTAPVAEEGILLPHEMCLAEDDKNRLNAFMREKPLLPHEFFQKMASDSDKSKITAPTMSEQDSVLLPHEECRLINRFCALLEQEGPRSPDEECRERCSDSSTRPEENLVPNHSHAVIA